MSQAVNVHQHANYCFPYPVPVGTSNVHAPSADTDAVISAVADGKRPHIVSHVVWSYSADPTGGKLTIQSGSDVVFEIDITKGGPGFVQFFPPISLGVNKSLTITLAAGGGSVSGKINALAWREE